MPKQSKDDKLKNRLEELFTSGMLRPDDSEDTDKGSSPFDLDKQDRSAALERQIVKIADGETPTRPLRKVEANNKRIKELNCLADIGHKIDEKPTIPDFLEWVSRRLPEAMEHPETSIAAITFNDKVYGNPDSLKLESKMVGGIRVQGNLQGYIHLAYTAPQTFIDEESRFIGAVVGRVSSYIESQQLLAEMQRRTDELSILNEMASRLAMIKTEQEVIEILFFHTSLLMDTTNFFLATYDEENDCIDFPFVQFDNVRVTVPGMPLSAGLTGQIIRTRQPLLISEKVSERMAELGIQEMKIQDDEEALSWLGVPMTYGEKVLGVITVQSTTIARLYKEHERDLLTAVAGQGAIAIQNAKSYEQMSSILARTEAMYIGSQRIIQAKSPQNVLDAILASTSLKVFDRANILLFDKTWEAERSEYYQVEAVWEKNGQASALPIGTVYSQKQMPIGELATKEAPTYISNIETDSRVHANIRLRLQSMGMTSIIVFPLVASDQWIGAVTAQASLAVNLNEREILQINSLVGQAAITILDQRLRRDLEDRLREMSALQQTISHEAWTSYLAREENESLGYFYDRMKVHPLQENSLTIEGDDGSGHVTADAGSQLKISAPLQVGGVSIGALGIQVEPGTIIAEEDQELIQSIAAQVSQALERARLVEQTQKSAVELQTVARVSSASSSILDPNDLLDQVVNLSKDSFHLYHAHIYLLDEHNTRLTLAAAAGEIGRSMVKEGWSILLDEASITTRAVHSQQGQMVNDVHDEPNFLPNPLLPETASELAVPMIVGQRVVGVFDVQSNRVNGFTEDDLQTFNTLATQTAVALQNARLFAEQLMTVERLRELDHLKSSFLANMSHELRTPLNSILGFTQVILEGIDGPLTDYMTADLQLIDKNGKHLLNLINEVLDMSKIESGRMSLTFEPVNLRHLLEDVLETTSPQANDHKVSVQLEIDPQTDLNIIGDSIRLRQVILNLMSNAIKFTEVGGVTVLAERDISKILITFKDTGIGIPENKLETIFEAFSQVDSTTTRKVGGTGLGLPISRRLVEMHGGHLWAKSGGIAGEGAEFFLELPIQGGTT